MFVAGPNTESRESATNASPIHREEGHCQTSASRLCCEVPEAATGRRASEATAERLPMSTSATVPHRRRTRNRIIAASLRRRPSGKKRRRRFVDGWASN